MLTNFVDRGLQTFYELERTIAEGRDEALSDNLLVHLMKIHKAVASREAIDLSEAATKAMYIRNVVPDQPYPNIGVIEWQLVESLLNDIIRLSMSSGDQSEGGITG